MAEADKTELYLISQGNELAFDYFMDAYSTKLYYHVYGIIGQHELAKEIVSDIFLEVWKRRKHITEIKDMAAWLNKIAFSKAVSTYRKEFRHDNISLDMLPQFHLPEMSSPLDNVMTEERRRLLYEAIDTLPPKCKYILILAKIEGMAYNDIAEMLHISKATVNYHISYALASLKKKLAKAI